MWADFVHATVARVLRVTGPAKLRKIGLLTPREGRSGDRRGVPPEFGPLPCASDPFSSMMGPATGQAGEFVEFGAGVCQTPYISPTGTATGSTLPAGANGHAHIGSYAHEGLYAKLKSITRLSGAAPRPRSAPLTVSSR